MFVLPNLSPLGRLPGPPTSSANYLSAKSFRSEKIDEFVRNNKNMDKKSPATSEFIFQYDKTDRNKMRKCTMKCELMSGGFHFYVQEQDKISPNKQDKHVDSADFAASATDTLEELLSSMYSKWKTRQPSLA